VYGAVYCVFVYIHAQANKSRDLVDANLVIYSVTDRLSFQYAQSCLQELRPAKRHNVVILVANKQDIVRNRVISEEGQLDNLLATQMRQQRLLPEGGKCS
jgi:Ras family